VLSDDHAHDILPPRNQIGSPSKKSRFIRHATFNGNLQRQVFGGINIRKTRTASSTLLNLDQGLSSLHTSEMGFITVQGLSSPTFNPPPLDGSFLLPEVLDHNAQHSPNHPLFVYADEDIPKTITWSHAVDAFWKAAHIFHRRVEPIARRESAPIVVAILASTGKSIPGLGKPHNTYTAQNQTKLPIFRSLLE
jgi:hypothetical protein